jgi:hypothetical protein
VEEKKRGSPRFFYARFLFNKPIKISVKRWIFSHLSASSQHLSEIKNPRWLSRAGQEIFLERGDKFCKAAPIPTSFLRQPPRMKPHTRSCGCKAEQRNPAPKHRHLLHIEFMRHIPQATQRMNQVNQQVGIQPRLLIAR